MPGPRDADEPSVPDPDPADPAVSEEEVRDMEQVALGAGHPVDLSAEEIEEHRLGADDEP